MNLDYEGAPSSDGLVAALTVEDELGATGRIPAYLLDILQHRLDELTSPFKYELLADSKDDDPFVGYRCPTPRTTFRYKFTTLQDFAADMYKRIGIDPLSKHSSKPVDRIMTTKQTDIRLEVPSYLDFRTYKRKAGGQRNVSVLDISKRLQGLLPHPKGGIGLQPKFDSSGRWKNDPAKQTTGLDIQKQEMLEADTACMEALAIVADEILHSRPDVNVCVPITFNRPYTLTTLDIDPTFFYGRGERHARNMGLWLSFSDGCDTILPVSLQVIGNRARPLKIYPIAGTDTSPMNGSRLKSATGYSWDASAGKLCEFFQGFPVLYISDCVILQPVAERVNERHATGKTFSYYQDDTFYMPRKFAPTWLLLPSLSPNNSATSPLFGVWNERSYRAKRTQTSTDLGAAVGMCRYTTPGGVVDEVRRLGYTVSWDRVPTKAFQIIDLMTDLTVVPPLNLPTIPQYLELLVDNQKSCALCYECIYPVRDDSPLCQLHTKRLIDLVSSKPFTTEWLVVLTSRTELQFRWPSDLSRAALVKKLVADLTVNGLSHVWVGDFEGICLSKPFAPVHFEVGIVNAGKPETKKHSGFLAYSQSPSPAAVTSEIQSRRAIVFKSGTFQGSLVAARLRPLNNPNAMSVWKHERLLKDVGFDEDKAIFLHWAGSLIDTLGIGRIMRNQGEPIINRNNATPRCRTVDLLQLWRDCSTYSDSLDLSSLYHTMYPGEVRLCGVRENWHTALWDALAAHRLFLLWLDGMKGLREVGKPDEAEELDEAYE